MAQPTNPNAATPLPGDARTRTENQETLLLSDVPNATALMQESVTPLPPGTIAHLNSTALAALSQRYDILAEAGHGSMGNVYKARDRETGETVALKLLKPEIASDQAMMERFKNELLFARKITHKNVCRVYEFNRIGGIAYTSMEFVEGESLRSVLNRFGGLPPRKAINLVQQICSGLKEAHAQGIVHRDLKPENVMIDGQGNVKIMDFGIARSMEALTRLTGSMVGTPAYMAPEQVAGKPVDYRTDIYALGLIMYEVFTGTPAFQADNAVAVALKQMREAPTPPHEVDPNVPVLIERAILKSLEKEPSKRFQSLAELETVLRAPAAPAVASNLADIPFNRPSHATPPVPPPHAHSVPAPKRQSSSGWVLLVILLVLVTLAGLRAGQIRNLAKNQLTPPAPLPAPAPPDFALEIPAASSPSVTSVEAEPEAPKAAEAKSADADPVGSQPVQPAIAPAPANASADSATPSPMAPVKHATAEAPPQREAVSTKRQPGLGTPPLAAPDVQQRADKAFGETQPAAAAPVNNNAPGYLWVGRFEREDRAQTTAKKIEDLGLPVVVIPRHNDKGRFFVVLTGPFGEKRVPSVLQWLQTQGFPDVREVKAPTGALNQGPNHTQIPNP